MDYELQVWIAVYAGEMASSTPTSPASREAAVRLAAQAVDDLRAFRETRVKEPVEE